jgi:hypothetical protein
MITSLDTVLKGQQLALINVTVSEVSDNYECSTLTDPAPVQPFKRGNGVQRNVCVPYSAALPLITHRAFSAVCCSMKLVLTLFIDYIMFANIKLLSEPITIILF